MNRPLIVITFVLSSGIFAASKIMLPLSYLYMLSLLFLILAGFFINTRVYYLFFCLLIFSLGIILLKTQQFLPKQHIAKYYSGINNTIFTVTGSITTEPYTKNNRVIFTLKTLEIAYNEKKFTCTGKILVSSRTKKTLAYGDELTVTGKLRRPFVKTSFNYLYNQNIYAIMNTKTENQLLKSNINKGNKIKKLAIHLKQGSMVIINKYLLPSQAAIMEAMILGEKTHIPVLISNFMMKTGTIHILVVSGFNVGIVSFLIILFLKLLRIPKRIRLVLTVFLLMLYCLMTGASTPVLRATIMADIFLISCLLKREPDISNSWAIAALIILSINPCQLFDIGFQLSFASVLAIIYLFPRIKSFLKLDKFRLKYLVIIIDGILVSFSVWLVILAIIAYHFRIISLITVLANLFIVPLATLITLSGFSLIIISLLLPVISPFIAASCGLFIGILLQINLVLAKLPWAYFSIPTIQY